MKHSAKMSLPATEIKNIYIYIYILHLPLSCQQMYSLVCIHVLYFVHKLVVSVWCSKCFVTVMAAGSIESMMLSFVLTIQDVFPSVHLLSM